MAEEISFASVLQGRADTYRLLSRLFIREVDDMCLTQLRAMRFPQETGSKNVDSGYRLMHAFLTTSGERALHDLQVDYVGTFIGAGTDGHSAAYPYESVYTSEDHLVMQDARDEVRAIYHAYGLEQSAAWKDGEDHMGIELEFMAVLADRSAQAARANDEEQVQSLLLTQNHFLKDHPGKWVVGLTTLMERFAKTDFYRGVAHLARGFIAQDQEFLDEITQSAASR